MNLATILSIQGGGAGSGCNPEAGTCGRPSLGMENSNKWVIPTEKKNTISVWKSLIQGETVDVTNKFNHLSEKKLNDIKNRIQKAGYKYGWTIDVKPTGWKVNYLSEVSKNNQLGQKSTSTEPKSTTPVQVQTKPLDNTSTTKVADLIVPRTKVQETIDKIAKEVGIDNLKLPSSGSVYDGDGKKQWDTLKSVYQQLGMSEVDLKEHAQRISSWSGSANDKFAKIAQDAVYSKAYKDSATKAMAIEYFVTQKILEVKLGKEIDLYRGIKSNYAQEAYKQAETRTMVTLNTRGADSWTNNEDKAKNFGGTILTNKFPREMIVTSYLSNDKLHKAFPSEHEFVVVTPGKELVLKDAGVKKDSSVVYGSKMKKIDVSDIKNFNWLHSMRNKKSIKAGGPGSGRHPWGRKQKDNSLRSPYQGKFPGPAGKPAVGLDRKNAPAPLYKKEFSREEEAKEKAGQKDLREWRSGLPNHKDWDPATKVSPGDEVKTLKTTKAFDNDKLEFKQFKPGTTLTVINVLPKVGNNPQLMVAQYPGRQGDMVHMPVTDVRLHRTLEGIQEKPAYKIREEIGLTKGIRPGKIAQQIETPTGATYTKLKPETAGRPQGSGNIKKSGNSDEHSLKGKFSPARGPKGNELKEIFTFDTRLKSFGQGTARATVWDASKTPRTPDQAKHGTEGTTVIAWRDTKNKSGKVMEFDKDANGYIKQGSKPMQSFSNLGKMGGYLKQRYGVSMKLPGDSVAKKGRKK